MLEKCAYNYLEGTYLSVVSNLQIVIVGDYLYRIISVRQERLDLPKHNLCLPAEIWNGSQTFHSFSFVDWRPSLSKHLLEKEQHPFKCSLELKSAFLC